MKAWLALPLMLGLAACMPAAPVELSAEEASELRMAIGNRAPGRPVSCVSQRELRGNRSVGEGAIIFETIGNDIYVNRPAAGCPEIRLGRTLVTRTTGSQLCRGDIADVVDLVSNTSFGGCALGDFIPYRRDP